MVSTSPFYVEFNIYFNIKVDTKSAGKNIGSKVNYSKPCVMTKNYF